MGEDKHDGLAVPGQIVLAHELPFTVGGMRVDPPTRQVECGGQRETLEPRVMQVLVALARARGSIVTRDELIDWCWDGRIVGEDAINRAISRLRQAAAETGGGTFAIETITKVGYRVVSNQAAPDKEP
jgi:DNA-binding winged helix-turn-helix (wHTH) protein